MKLFILFILFCGIFADGTVYPKDPAEDTVIPDYASENKYVANCKEYSVVNEVQDTCTTCHDEFTLGTKQEPEQEPEQICSASDVRKGPVTTSNGKFVHAEIGWDTKTKTCTKTIGIVNANGNAINSNENGYLEPEKSCLACAVYSDDSTKCKICATGYLENGGGCTPITDSTFGIDDQMTYKYCVYGAYESGNAKCYACSGPTKLDNGVCKNADNIDTFPEGCVKKTYDYNNNVIKCDKCKEEYFLVNGECIQSNSKDPLCVAIDNKKNCIQCLPGYYAVNGYCYPYTIRRPTDLVFDGDECGFYASDRCHYNPNCITEMINYEKCISRHCDMFSKSETTVIQQINYPKCLRCEQGYKLNSNNECVKCENGCFTNEQKTTCEKGYYLAKDGNNGKVCRKCEGKCVECTSKTQCVEGKMDVDIANHGFALNGLPCLDGNCKLCSSEDPSICYECRSENSELIGGKCYNKPTEIANNVGQAFDGCRYYEQPTSTSDSENYLSLLEPVYKKDDVNQIEIVVKNENNQETTTNVYLCKYRDFLPYYYKYDGNELSCAGANRDPHNDCECNEGYYPSDASKTSNCKKTSVAHCKIALSDKICMKCNEGMIAVIEGTSSNVQMSCGCPHENQRINHHGVCVTCPEDCASCVSEVHGTDSAPIYHTQCKECIGKVDASSMNLVQLNYNKNLANHCKCNDNYIKYDDGSDQIYSCFHIPPGCSQEGHYSAQEFSVSCETCDKQGFTVASSCSTCDLGYYEEYEEDGKTVKNCKRCHEVVSNTGITYSLKCNAQTSLECVDQNLDPAKKCMECKEGYSLIFVKNEIPNDDETINIDMIHKTVGIEDPIPKCIHCGTDCKLTESHHCFFAEAGQYDSYKVIGRKRDSANLYTFDMLKNTATHLYCDACKTEPQQQAHLDCACGQQYYLHLGDCADCSVDLGQKKFDTTNTLGAKVEVTYNDVCKLSDGCENTPIGLKCKVCLNPERDPETNCQTCIDTNYYAVYDDSKKSESNKGHLCVKCNDKCITCENGNTCTECAGTAVTGELCDTCISGYYVKSREGNTVTCERCPSQCTVCESETKCTACKKSNHAPGPNNDCKACQSGYYYNLLNDDCVEISKGVGISESIPICLKADGTQIDCTEQNKNVIAEIKEKPVKCDITLGVGISPYPVNDLCVCDTGYLDNRTDADITSDPIPQCVSVKEIGEGDEGDKKDPFCIDAKFKDETKKSIECLKCNADYLEIDTVTKKCKCKKTHYATSWGMCVPCGRHNKGCLECSGENAKYFCDKCDESAYKLGGEEKDDKGNKVRKCVGK